MNDLTIEGVVTLILQEENGVSKAGKDWKKKEFSIETKGEYPKTVAFTCFGDKTDLLSNITQGQNVAVSFNLESREYNGRFFHNVNAWRIVVEQPSAESPSSDTDNTPTDTGETNDLPF